MVLEKKFHNYFRETTAKVNLICIGLGGAGQLAINAARLGVGQMHVIDPKLQYSDTNMITQEVSAFAFGQPKAQAVAEEALEILKFANPKANVFTYMKPIQDVALDELLRPDMHNIVMLNTDNIAAQLCGYKFIWRNALDSVVSQSFQLGLGGEISFTIGHETPCHYCVSMLRMRAAEIGVNVAIDSFGGTVFSAAMLNAIAGHFLLSLVFRQCAGSTAYYGLLDKWKKRNLGFVSMHPNSERLLSMSHDEPWSPFGIQMWDEDILPRNDCIVCLGQRD